MVLLQGNNSSQLLQMCLLCIAELPACKEKLQAVDAIVRQLLSHREEMETIMLSEAGAGIIEGVFKVGSGMVPFLRTCLASFAAVQLGHMAWSRPPLAALP